MGGARGKRKPTWSLQCNECGDGKCAGNDRHMSFYIERLKGAEPVTFEDTDPLWEALIKAANKTGLRISGGGRPANMERETAFWWRTQQRKAEQ